MPNNRVGNHGQNDETRGESAYNSEYDQPNAYRNNRHGSVHYEPESPVDEGPIQGMEKESKEKQDKYKGYFETGPGEKIIFTGMYKYVETNKFKEDGTRKIKRKRIFKRLYATKRTVSEDMRAEIKAAFHMFDQDGSNSIDVNELRDAMKCLGIYLTKQQTAVQVEKADKDSSGFIDLDEFVPLMTDILGKRNQYEEISKSFRYYDNDDDGQISYRNLMESADLLDMEDYVNEANISMMIEMADPLKKGYVDFENYIELMYSIGLIPDEKAKQKQNDMEREADEARANLRSRGTSSY